MDENRRGWRLIDRKYRVVWAHIMRQHEPQAERHGSRNGKFAERPSAASARVHSEKLGGANLAQVQRRQYLSVFGGRHAVSHSCWDDNNDHGNRIFRSKDCETIPHSRISWTMILFPLRWWPSGTTKTPPTLIPLLSIENTLRVIKRMTADPAFFQIPAASPRVNHAGGFHPESIPLWFIS